MGLDQYAYSAARAGQRNDYWENYDVTSEKSTVPEPKELAYWRKHPNLQGWMRLLWESRFPKDAEENDFNGIEIELTWEDLDQLEEDVTNGRLAEIAETGFFFGDPADEHYKDRDLEFIKQARADLFTGLRVFYNSSW